jgi:hypothetical protein
MLQFRWLATGFSPQSTGAIPMSLHVEFVVHKVAEEIFLQVFLAIIIPSLLHTHLSMPSLVWNSADQAVHYHTVINNIAFGSITDYRS